MQSALNAIGRRLLSTESEWNPKVILGRAAVAVLPTQVLHRLRKSYYAYLLAHLPDDWQERDTSVVKHLIRSGDHVLDIGASIGGYTRFLSQTVGPFGRVYSFEPNPPIHEYLAYNVTKLGLQNVKLYDCALSESDGVASIAIPRYRWGSECHYDATLESKRASADCRRVNVPVCTLDSLFAHRAEEISFIKCDVNYHELPCLRGALQTIQRSKPAILIEILPNPDKPGGPASQVFALLEENSYQPYWFDGVRLRRRKPGERSQNYFFLTPERFEQLPAEFVSLSS
jgi:FkbM family methyltransferase